MPHGVGAHTWFVGLSYETVYICPWRETLLKTTKPIITKSGNRIGGACLECGVKVRA